MDDFTELIDYIDKDTLSLNEVIGLNWILGNCAGFAK